MTEQSIDYETGEVTAIAVREENMPVMLTADPVQNFRQMRALVKEVATDCQGPAFMADIQGRKYPTVQWWTTVGASLGLFPYEVSSEKVTDEHGNWAYVAYVEIRRNGMAVTSASSMCSSGEVVSRRTGDTWGDRGEYAVKSMATTRATAKAYRLGLSFLAVLAGLEATPAEEMPRDGGSFDRRPTASGSPGKRSLSNAKMCPEHKQPWAQNKSGRFAHPIKDGDTLTGWCNQDEWEAKEMQPAGEAAASEDAPQSVGSDPEGLPW